MLLYAASCLLFSFSSIFPQGLKLSLIGGVSKEFGPRHESFNWGFTGGGDLFFYVDDNILLGMRVSYTRFTPNQSRFNQSIREFVNGQVSGNAFVTEITPSLRLTTRYPLSNVNIFLQAGAGIYVLGAQISVGGGGEDVSGGAVEAIFGDGKKGHFGMNIGGGITLGNPELITIDLYPMFHLVLPKNRISYKYFTFNVAVGIGI
jgi:hypothetical protein